MDEDPLICYGRMRVFMYSLGVACNTSPAPPERLSPPFNTLSPADVNPFDAAPLLLTQCIGLCDTAPSPSCSSLPGDV